MAEEVVVIPVRFTTVEVKLEEVETWSPYDVAPLEAFQVSVGLVEIPVAPFEGEESVGTGGGVPPEVTKLQTVDQLLVPEVFAALTLQ
jgi:hypothetical protein